MQTKTATWFETSVRYERQQENASLKYVTELYVVDAVSFGEAEQIITEEMSAFASGGIEIRNITPATYKEIAFSDKETDDRWYKAKLAFIMYDEKTQKEKRTSVTYLVQAASFNGALKNVEEMMKGAAIDYVILNITETKIMDVYKHQ